MEIDITKHYFFKYTHYIYVADIAVALGVVLLICNSLNSCIRQKNLEQRIFQWLGKASFNLYLRHPLVLISSIYILKSKLNLVMIVCFVPFLSLCTSYAMYKQKFWEEVYLY